MGYDKGELLLAVKEVKDFVHKVPGGESFWKDAEGNVHTADIGYVWDFLCDLEQYLLGN